VTHRVVVVESDGAARAIDDRQRRSCWKHSWSATKRRSNTKRIPQTPTN
jgi:hypothetical protein